MLAQKSFSKTQVDGCRESLTAMLDSYGRLTRDDTLEAFEQSFVQTMVLALDRCFVHRMRGQEGKGETALKRVRDLADAAAEGRPEPLTSDEFRDLADAFFTDLEVKFPPA